ncbi:expressed unknown protein [Seminavis robusta]|uniref:SET domain-containing protein n=1 Tax=Seminavis robusta TaxID=568900 RepID=A0A9N8DVI8_9STRA|nr:expressed unknown protein [Seminavis robusta]|eukprot:Sro403_g135760.1 n/a (243) ;mRNA; r:60124-60852
MFAFSFLTATTVAFAASSRQGVTVPVPTRTTRYSSSSDDTIESLTDKLQQALEDKAGSPFQVLNSRLSSISLHRTHVGVSPIAGRGLFASCNCPAGTLLTCYPGDGIVDFDDDDDEEPQVYWGDHTKQEEQDGDWDPDYLLSMNNNGNDDEMMGLVGLPSLDGDSAYLGHLCNDGTFHIPMTVKEIVTQYLNESPDRANAMEQSILDCHMVLVSTRDISKDEEIFLCYGPEYWMQRPGFGAS